MNEPLIKELSYERRQRFFLVLVGIFLVALPTMIFYTAGYRLDLDNDEQTIITTGGMYITADNLEVQVYLDEVQVERPRFFRSAYYIQNITVGQHRVVVQRPDLQTWVKVLPVDPHIVIEAAAFNMPAIPHLRPITEYVTATGTPVYLGVATTSDLFAGVTTTVPVLQTPSIRTAPYAVNKEYLFVQSLFGTTSVTARSVFAAPSGTDRFRFATTTGPSLTATTTESMVQRGDIRIVARDRELYAIWLGDRRSTPHYFCVADDPMEVVAERYGQHVADAVVVYAISTTTPLWIDGDRVCRPEIKLDRLRKDVYFYDFFPGSSDLVLLQLEDGLYVTEIDDRAWQNVQQLYSGTDFRVVIESGVIYIQDGDRYFELVTEIELI